MPTILKRDNELSLPNFTLVSASAGSGKTHTLTLRYLQFLLSPQIPFNELQNVLAITFTNNASIEMKGRIIETLKEASFGNKKHVSQLAEVLSLDAEAIQTRSAALVDTILDRYSDLQAQTIDSFLTRIMKVSALEFGLPPHFELVLDSNALLDEAFALFAQHLATDRHKRELFELLIERVNENQTGNRKFLWNPYDAIAREVKDLYRRLGSHLGRPVFAGGGSDLRGFENEMLALLIKIGESAEQSGFKISATFHNMINAARAGNVAAIVGKKLDQKVLNKSKEAGYEDAVKRIEQLQQTLMDLVSRYVFAKARQYYRPYVQAHLMLIDSIEAVKRLRGQMDLGEASKNLALSLHKEQVPEIYFSLGNRIHHYLIDEFQDTNPIQWATLRPLIEETVGSHGSLFLVGDTKQAIFTFRGGDWKIMKRMLNEEEFLSVLCDRISLPYNYRSAEAVITFAKKVFHEIVPTQVSSEIADLSGLASFKQGVLEEQMGRGYVELQYFDPHEMEHENPPERRRLVEILRACTERGFSFRNIAILTPRNEDVVRISGWLNEEQIKFLSHSSLDIRTRKITGEILALLKFLDSPIDDLSFAEVLLGTIFCSATSAPEIPATMHVFLFEQRQARGRPRALYTSFRESYPKLWDDYFEHLLNVVGYLPVYDLVAEMYKLFSVFDLFPEEESTLLKLLEVIREFETAGSNNLNDFLSHAEEDSADVSWDIPVSPDEDAVTVMTVHKAKGLGFPVVIVLLYDGMPRSENLFIDERDGNIELLRITSDDAGKNQELAILYDRAKNLQRVDELNKLYVALTRAEEELYVLSVKANRGDTPSKYLPPDGYRDGERLRAREVAGMPLRAAVLLHTYTRGLRPSITPQRIGLEETKRGDFIHAILSRITYVDERLDEQISREVEILKKDVRESFDLASIKERIAGTVKSAEIARYFVPERGRTVLNEPEVTTADGRLYRLDRLVVDPDVLTVIDYKTGVENPEYDEQVRRYMKIVREIFPGRLVRGYLAYVDLNIIRNVADTDQSAPHTT